MTVSLEQKNQTNFQTFIFNIYLMLPYEKFGKYKDQLIHTFENLEHLPKNIKESEVILCITNY